MNFEETRRQHAQLKQRSRELLSQARQALDQRKQWYEEHGITPEAIHRFLESEHISPQQRQQAQQELQTVRDDIEASARRIKENFRAEHAQQRRHKKPRRGRMI
jgi:hypothetical protein